MTKKKTRDRVWKGPRDLERMLVPIDDLAHDPSNPRQHDERNLEAIRASLFQFGQLRPLVVRKASMHVVAGNGALSAARALGWTHVAALVLTMTDAQARAYAIADNRTAELATWNVGNLTAALSDPELDELLGATGFSAAEIDKLIGEEAAEGLQVERDPATTSTSSNTTRGARDSADDEGDDDDDEADAPAAVDPADDELPELPEAPVTQPGDVWVCGDHEVLCADSFGDVAAKWIGRGKFAAVVTDPPYAIFGSSTGIASDIADDKMVRPFFAQLGRLIAAALKLFGHAYVFTDWRSWASLWEGLRNCPVRVRNMLVWNKRGSGLGSNYAMTHELVAFAHHLPAQKAMSSAGKTGVRSVLRPNVFEFNRPTGDERPHNASKPVALLQHLIENSTDAGDLVLEPFGGGGSTLIACERTGRRCRLIEIEPKWVDVIVRRWERVTARKAERRPAR